MRRTGETRNDRRSTPPGYLVRALCRLAPSDRDDETLRLMSGAELMLAAWVAEALFGYPAWLYRRIRHPVVWMGALIGGLERILNRPGAGLAGRYCLGLAATLVTVALATGAALAVSTLLPTFPSGSPPGLMPIGWLAPAAIASSLIASRSLYGHVAAVADALGTDDLAGARNALSHIVGRDTAELSPAAAAGAALESLAENTSDGVIAPIFWGVLLGLPGLAAYKAVNTLDSMIGHRNERYAAFGGFAARLDDVANWLPARLTGVLFATASLRPAAFTVMWRDARKHRSPNAGWPESATAGALGVRLSGPRLYGGTPTPEPWLNAGAREPGLKDLRRGMALYVRAAGLAGALLAAIALLPRLS